MWAKDILTAIVAGSVQIDGHHGNDDTIFWKAVVSRELRCGAVDKRKAWRDTGDGREVKVTVTRRAIRQNTNIRYD